MKFWHKRSSTPDLGRGLALAALADAPRPELLREALDELRVAAVADRIGIWMSECPNDIAGDDAASPRASQEAPAQGAAPQQATWRGLVWDRESDSTPVEWQHLSAEAPLPQEVFLGAAVFEQELPVQAEILIGVFIGLRRALWIPIASRGRVHGVILCGTRTSQPALPRSVPLRVAAELALQLAWREERRVARERYADLSLARRVHAELQQSNQAELALAHLTDNIVASASGGGLEAAFAAIAVLASPRAAASPRAEGAAIVNGTEVEIEVPLEFSWKSGDADWLRAAESGPVAEVCQYALRARRTHGVQPEQSWLPGDVARVIAVPIEFSGQPHGVLLAGLSRRAASLAAVERLEHRALLTAMALEQRSRKQEAILAACRQRELLSTTVESLVVLDDALRIADLSTSAEELLASSLAAESSSATAGPRQATPSLHIPLYHLLSESAVDRQRLTSWLLRPPTSPRDSWASNDDAVEVPLRDGTLVRFRRALPNALSQTVLILEKIATGFADAALEPPSDFALQGVIEWLEEGVVMFDAHDRVRARNTRFEQFAGLGTSETAQGATLEELIAKMQVRAAAPQQFAERWRELARSSEGGMRDEVRLLQPTPRLLERASRPVLDSIGRRIGRVEIYRDLTARRVFQSQLLQTEKLAALGQMLTGVAHELSNPLTSILGYAQRLLLREDFGANLPEVRQIFQEAERASGILRQLLFNAREAPPERRRVTLNQVVMRSMELQRFSMAAENVRFELDLDPALPMVMGDAAQLQQVLMNLVGNARQAIQQEGHGGRIRVRTSQTAERRVLLEIEDDGPGVPQSILARIFDPFFTTKAAGVGTGLGLSIVLSIVREHGGRVNVLRAPEGGAIFAVELPMAEGVVSVPAMTTSTPPTRFASRLDLRPEPGPSAYAGAVAIGGERVVAPKQTFAAATRRAPEKIHILVVEDEPTVARLIADVLQDEGFAVDVLLDGREALERAARKNFDLVICDMKMPGLDGQQFFQSLILSGNPLWRSFLFVTGDVIAPATQAFLERHHLAHLAKPFRVEELTARVQEVLEGFSHATASAVLRPAVPDAARNAAGK